MAWTDKQQLAINTRDKTLLVSAAAGSGKTATLTQRIIESLTDSKNPADISRMLIVTFTRASAADLKAKISKALSKALVEKPDDEHLTKQLIALGSAHISTIDSFYYEVVKNNFQKLSLAQVPRIADSAEIAPLNSAIMEETIEDLFFTEGFDRFTEHFSSARGSGKIGEIFLQIYTALLSLRNGVETLKDYENDLLEAADTDFFKTKYGQSALSQLEAFFNYAVALSTELAEESKCDEEASRLCTAAFESDISLWKSILGYIKTKNYEHTVNSIGNISYAKLGQNKSKNPLAIDLKGKRDKLKTSVGKIKDRYLAYTPEEISKSFRENAVICKKLHELLSEFDKRVYEEKKARGAFSFNDIRRFVLDLLYDENGNPNSLADEYREKFDYIYIDEYQDVDDVQDAIFTAIARPNNRFMVGDIKQSIYGFRGANPSIFADYKRSLPPIESTDGESGSLFMSENFRCDETVVNFSNTVSSFLFSTRAQSIEYSGKDDLRFAKPCDDPEHIPTPAKIAITGIIPDDTTLDDDQKAENAKEAARYIAREIKRIVGKEKLAAKLNDDGVLEERIIDYKDIAIMARGKKDFPLLQKELSALGIPAENPEETDFFENPEIMLVMSLLTTIDNPQKDISLAGTLRSPFFNFSLDDIIRLRHEASDNSLSLYDALVERIAADDALGKKCAKFNSFLTDWRSAAEASPCDRLIKQLYSELSLLSYSKKSAKNLQTLYERAISFESSGFKGLYSFIKYVNELIESKATIGGADRTSDDNSVKFMSIHHSKGLEYPVCFIYQCEKQFNEEFKKAPFLLEPSLGIGFLYHDETGFAKYQSPFMASISDTISVLQREEEMRLLYVAMTRAIERLYVVANIPEPAKKLDKSINLLKYDQNYAVLNAKSYIEWIMMSLGFSKHPESFEVHKIPTSVLSAPTEEIQQTETSAVASNEPLESADPELVKLLQDRFNFKYEYDHISDLPAKLSVSALSPKVLDLADENAASPESLSNDFEKQFGKSFVSDDSFGGIREISAAEKGTATHAFLQFCDFENVLENGIDEEIARLKEMHFIPTHYAEIINRDQLKAFFESKLFARIQKAKRLWREQRFNIFLPASDFTQSEEKSKLLENEKIAVQGVIDIFFEDADGKIVLCDYKTDTLTKSQLSSPELAAKKLSEAHSEQLSYYAKAIEEMLEKAPDDVLIYSLPLGDDVEIDISRK